MASIRKQFATALMLLPALTMAQTTSQSLDEKPQSRGALLYDTHCIACHNTEVHWRDKSVVKDWSSLIGEVRRWQASTTLRWSEDDILQVAQYLDALYYHLPPPKK